MKNSRVNRKSLCHKFFLKSQNRPVHRDSVDVGTAQPASLQSLPTGTRIVQAPRRLHHPAIPTASKSTASPRTPSLVGCSNFRGIAIEPIWSRNKVTSISCSQTYTITPLASAATPPSSKVARWKLNAVHVLKKLIKNGMSSLLATLVRLPNLLDLRLVHDRDIIHRYQAPPPDRTSLRTS